MDSHLYNINLQWKNDRIGEISSPELNHKITIATPPEFPKGVEGIWSPEHLFTAAVNSCFMTTFLAIAENSKLAFSSFSCESKGKLEQVEGKFLMTEIALEPTLIIYKSEDFDKAEKILQKAEKACLISNSIKSAVVLQTNVKVLENVMH
jgi:peroxiredoxin-like protein